MDKRAPGESQGDDRAAAIFVRAVFTRDVRAVFTRDTGTVPVDIPVRVAAAGVTRAYGDALGLHLPGAFPMYGPGSALARRARFAAAAHLAAHVRFGGRRLARGGLRPIQVVLVSLFEDARVERLAASDLPGLVGLWAPFHTAMPTDLATFPALCARLARALLVPTYADPHPVVAKARALFFHADHDLTSAEGSRRAGSLLGNDVGQMRLSFNAKEYVVEPPYRDDHRLLWEEPENQPASGLDEADVVERRAPADAPPDDSPPREVDGAPDARQDQVGRARAAPPVPVRPAEQAVARQAVTYPEWDHRIGASRPSWCTVREQADAAPAPAVAGAASGENRPSRLDAEALARVARLARRLRVEDLVTRRHQRDGDTLDLDAAVAAVVDRRAGAGAGAGACGASGDEPRVYSRAARRHRDLAVLLLLDLSASTGDPVRDDAGRVEGRVIDLECRAATLLAEVLARTGALFAVHGFASNGRHQVEYHRFKDLDTPWDDRTRTRLGAITPGLSTRMGAALRHAGRCLHQVRRDRRLILLLTDGEPADVDAPDPSYLLEDARHAVAEQRRRGVHVFGINLDAGGDPYVRRIFGDGGYWIVDRIARLPEALPRLYARLVR